MPGPELKELEARLGHSFQNPSLLGQALTHASATTGEAPDNERLEFLGDAVVGLAVNDHLYRSFTRCEEGTLTQIKSTVVSAQTLARRARALRLPEFARLGRGMPAGGELSDSVLANLFEAVVGALYLDAGFERAGEFVLDQLLEEIEDAASLGPERNFKAALQQLAGRRFGELPRYRTVSESGPDHGKVFEVEAVAGGRVFPPGRGRTKKDAEQEAAANAIEALRGEAAAGDDASRDA
jgi:ribonuclease-3